MLVPDRLKAVFGDAVQAIEQLKADYRDIAQKLNRVAKGPGGEVVRHNLRMRTRDGVESFSCTDLANSLTRLENGKPFVAECPDCHAKHPGKYVEGCKACHGLGWGTQDVFDRTLPEHKAEVLLLCVELTDYATKWVKCLRDKGVLPSTAAGEDAQETEDGGEAKKAA